MNEDIKERYRTFLELDVKYPEGKRSCAYCKRSLPPDNPVIEMEIRTKSTRYVYRFCQDSHVSKGWPVDEPPED